MGIISNSDKLKGARFLLVEDNEINQMLAEELLKTRGISMVIAGNGQKGLDQVRASASGEPFDAILMALQMPVMDGKTATKEIRKMDSAVGQVPIIAMTADAVTGVRAEMQKIGMNDYLTKPIDPDRLFSVLQKWIKPVAERAIVQKPLVLDTPPKPDQVVLGKDELPESLPEFDLTAGLPRFMGNKRLYRKLLIDFGVKFSGTAEEIGEAITANDFEQAHNLVHALKGVVGNLEATDLHSAVVKMEKLVRGQSKETVTEKELEEKLFELKDTLSRAVDAVQTLGRRPAERKIITSVMDEMATVPTEFVKKAVRRIRVAAETGNMMQIKSIAEELKSESDAVAPFCDELARLAEDFDFDGIQKLVLALDS